MKKILILIGLVSTICLSAQESEKYNISFGIKGGVGQNVNAFRLTDKDGFKFTEEPAEFSMGIDFGVFVMEKFRVRLDFRYVQMGYGVDWTDNNYAIKNTDVTLHSFDMNFQFDYRLLSTNKFDVYVSPGFVAEYVVNDEHFNHLDDGSTSYNVYNFYPDDAFPSTITGVDCAIIAKYKITENIGVTFTPEYTMFLRKFNKDNSSGYQRYGANLGVEFTF